MVSKKAVGLKMAIPVLLLILLVDMSATARAEHMIEFLKQFTSENHQAYSEYKSGCCNNCDCEGIWPLQECRCADWYDGDEACNKLAETCKNGISLLIWPPRCTCLDTKTSCNSCASTTAGAGGAEVYIMDRAT